LQTLDTAKRRADQAPLLHGKQEGGFSVQTHHLLTFEQINSTISGRYGKFDLTCPFCSASRSTAENRRKKVFRVWRDEPGFITYLCVHCEAHGYLHAKNSAPIPVAKIAEMRREADRRAEEHRQERLSKARWLWRASRPIQGTVAERYLRNRAITVPLPATLRFLPARDEYPPAMIAAFGFPREPDPGKLEIAERDVVAVQMTRLKPDGRGKANIEPAKMCIGVAPGVPIVLAPPNDALALGIGEGIEDMLSAHQLLGIGAWAATGAKKLEALAAPVPAYIETVHIFVDHDLDGLRGAQALATELDGHGCEIRLHLAQERRAAA
jgi:hypothetical protein